MSVSMQRHPIRQSFDRAATSYNATAKLQEIVANRVVAEAHQQLGTDFRGRLLDAGCGTGYCLRQLQSQHPDAALTGLDFAEHMLRQLPHPLQQQSLLGNIEQLPLADASFDVYISSLAWQWCDPLVAAREARRVLRPDGKLIIATLTTGTFRELASCLEQIGHSAAAHILPFRSPQHITDTFTQAGLPIRTIRQETITTWHPDFRTLRHSIRDVGANHLPGGNTVAFSRSMRWALLDAYEALRCEPGLPLSYNVLIIDADRKADAA